MNDTEEVGTDTDGQTLIITGVKSALGVYYGQHGQKFDVRL